MTPRTYSSPLAFKQALEQRLRLASKTGTAFARKRQLLVFDRFLARIVAGLGNDVTLKGGLALELRLEQARTTKDVDLRVMGLADDILSRMQEAGRKDLGDFMTFEVGPDDDHPEIVHEGMQYEGLKFRAECRLAGKLYAQPFGVDVAFGDPITGEPDVVFGEDTLSFAGIVPLKIHLYPPETHIAEKLHAYTLPRSRPNSRIKDLPDLALLATVRDFDSSTLLAAIEQTFKHRSTHSVPVSVPEASEAWKMVYPRIAEGDGLQWHTLEEVTKAVQTFLNPVLAGTKARWRAETWSWHDENA
jgi:hypothetical protein